MDIELPNGVVIQDIPEGTSKNEVMAKAIKAGLATPEDFAGVLGMVDKTTQPLPPSTANGKSTSDKKISRTGIPLLDLLNANKNSLIGAGETGLTLLTGGTTGLLGTVGGALSGAYEEVKSGQFGTPEAARRIEERAASGGQQYTYMPRTQAGQEQVQMLGRAGAELIPLAPVLPSGLFNQGTRPAIVAPVQRGVSTVRSAFQESPSAQAMRQSGGAAATAMPLVRETTSANLPVPVTLTKGAATREAQQLAFEKEQMKGQFGAPLRQRVEQNNLEILQNFDALMEMTGAEVAQSGFAATGNKVIDALSQGWQGAKAKTSAAYTRAEKAGELQAPVALDALADYINQNMPESTVAPVINVAKSKGIQLGVFEQLDDGTIRALPADLKNTELLRRSIGNTIGIDPTNKKFGGELKQVIDASTEGVGGDLYKQARALREQQARKFEGRAIVANLLTKVKGKDDPKIEASEVFQKSVLNGSPEEITFLKRVLYTSGKDGQTAWKEVQGSTINHIQEVATSGVGTDSMGRKIVSPAKLNEAIKGLDKNGRLDIVLGKDKAQTIRDLNEVLQYVQTVPPGTLVNTSGTAGVILAAMAEAGTTGFLTGLPVPVISGVRIATQYVKDRKLKARIEDALKKGD
jgi:hypothetical protein